jgi:hypothetical protein
METENLPQERSLQELARETFGSEYHEEHKHAPNLTLDDAYERLQEKKDARHEEQPSDTTKESPSIPDPQPTVSDAIWSNDDLQTITVFQREAERFQADLQAFAQVQAQIDLNAIEKQDKAQAAAVRTQLKAAEQELRERQDALNAVGQELGQKVQKQQIARLEQVFAREKAKLEEAMPGLNPKALRTYLEGVGFTDTDIAQAADHRLVVLAEKARRYDELMAGKGKTMKTIPTRKRKVQTSNTPMRKGEPTVKELHAKLRRTGRIDDALALLTASRRGQ